MTDSQNKQNEKRRKDFPGNESMFRVVLAPHPTAVSLSDITIYE